MRVFRTVLTHTALAAFLLAPPGVNAQTGDAAPTTPVRAEPAFLPAGIVDLDSVTVTGAQPGPGLWRVAKGDHELWILGSLSPLPVGINWNSDAVVDLVSQSQEVLWRPSFEVGADVGFFSKVSLGLGMLSAAKNPGGEKLADVLSPALYARFAAAKQRYLPRDRGIERKRPMLAAEELFAAATRDAGLVRSKIISAPILAVTKAQGTKVTTPKISVKIADPAGAVKDIRRMSLNDSACLEATLDAIDQLLPCMMTNGNAWATGDLEKIRFHQLSRRNTTCTDVFSNAEFSRKWGIPDIRPSLRNEWLKVAQASLAANTTTFAVLPLEDIVGPEGYAARLQALGYEVQTP